MFVQQDAPSPPRQPADDGSGVKEADLDDLPSVDLDPRKQDLWQALDQPSEPSGQDDDDKHRSADAVDDVDMDSKAQDALALQSPEDESLQRPFSLQTVALSDQESSAPEASDSASASAGKQQHKPAELNLSNSQPADASASASHKQGSSVQEQPKHPEIDLDLDDLESVSCSATPNSASTDQQPATSIGRLATSHSFNAISSPSLSASSISNPASPASNKLAQPPTPSSKVSNLRSRFEQQQSPTIPTASAHERQTSNHTLTSSTSSSSVATQIKKSPSGPVSGSPTKPQQPASPAAPVTPPLSSADKRRSLQMLQADFQRKKAELQHHQPAAAVDLKQKGKEDPIREERDEIDWDFWSLVVNDYTAVARDQRQCSSPLSNRCLAESQRCMCSQATV